MSTNRKANILGTSRDIEAKFASLSCLTNISICCYFGQIQRWVGVVQNDPQVTGATKALKGGEGDDDIKGVRISNELLTILQQGLARLESEIGLSKFFVILLE